MNSQIKIEVIDKDGWRKEFAFQKSLFHIGSAAVNDLVLENAHGGGVAARHAQLIALPDGTGYRLVNLGDTDILLNEAGNKLAPPHSVASVSDGSIVKVGDFTLIFHGEAMMIAAAPTDGRSSHIGLRLSLPRTKLAPHQSLAGVLAVGNHGDQAGVQFDLDLEGLEPDCYNIEPAPLLSSGSEREVALRIFHRGNKPLAGEHTLTIRATAPGAYPDEEATVRCVIQVQPFYQHTLRPASTASVPVPLTEDLLPPTISIRSTVPPVTPRVTVAATPPVTAQKPPAPIWEEAETPVTKTDVMPAISEKQQVLTLKAAPSPEVQVEPQKTGPIPSAAEDWWAVPEIAAAPPATVEAEVVTTPESAAPENTAPEEPDIAEAPPLNSVEAMTESEVEAAIETPAMPPVEVWETTPETVASVDETAEGPKTLIKEPEVTPDAPIEEITAVEAPLEQEPIPPVAEAIPTPADDDWWATAETPLGLTVLQEEEEPQSPVLKVIPPSEGEPALPGRAEAEPTDLTTPPQADDWWSETTDTRPEKEDTPPVANEDWWSA